MSPDKPEPDFAGYLIVAPRHLLAEIVQDDSEGPRVPATASEAREKRILNRRLDRFWLT
jgi:hypothetical protein